MWQDQPEDYIQDQAQHEPHAKGAIINETLRGEVKRPATLPFWEIDRTGRWLGLEELRVEFQEGGRCQEDQQ